MPLLHESLESQDYFYTKLQGGIIVYLELLYIIQQQKESPEIYVPSPEAFPSAIAEMFVIFSILGSGLLYLETGKRQL